MKYALVDGQRQEAQPGLSGECPAWGCPMVARCGEFNVWHWAHRSRSHCDTWWENEGPWHRNWKSQFPTAWQEVLQTAEDGERHIADVKTDRDWVLEFQNSYLNPQERRSRDAFYSPKLGKSSASISRRKRPLCRPWLWARPGHTFPARISRYSRDGYCGGQRRRVRHTGRRTRG